jgi:NADPH2:quinone reductase
MRAVLTDPPGGLAATRLTDVPEPAPGENDVVIEIHAAALNPADRFLIDGQYPGGPKPPMIVGRDAAGVIVQADRAGKFAVGDKVLVLQSSLTDLSKGTLCERQRFPAASVARMPAGWSFAEAAAAPLVFQTAWQALTCQGEPKAGQVVAVIGAGGGVGLAAVQLARGLGATVIALARSSEKLQRLKDLGVPHAIALDQPDLKKAVLAAAGNGGVHIVVDTVGGPLLTTAVHLLAPRGYVGVLGVLGGVEGNVPIPSLMFKQASIHGILVSGCTPEEAQGQWSRIVDVLTRSNQRPIVDRTFALTDYAAAFARLNERPFGKVVVNVR